MILPYQDVLQSKTYRDVDQAYQSPNGLFQAEKRKMEKMCEVATPSHLHNFHRVVSEAPWNWEPVMNRIGQDLDALFRAHPERTGLLIDESGGKKAGQQSGGVARQY